MELLKDTAPEPTPPTAAVRPVGAWVVGLVTLAFVLSLYALVSLVLLSRS